MTMEMPSFIRFVSVFSLDEDIYSVTISISRPEQVGNETVTDWEIEGIMNHSTGMMYSPESSALLTKKIEKELTKRKLFDAEYIYYKTLAEHEL